jgi:hypothetical protein
MEMLFAAVHESGCGTFETCRPTPSMSVHRGRPEVVGAQVETTHLDRRYLRSYPVSRIVRCLLI